MKDGILTCLAVLLVCVLGVGLVAGVAVLGYTGGLFHRVASPDAAVDSYEWYEQQYRDVKATEGQLRDAEEALAEFDKTVGAEKRNFFEQQERERLASNVVGLKQYRRQLIAAYNARSAMVTRNLWKSSTLPQHLEE